MEALKEKPIYTSEQFVQVKGTDWNIDDDWNSWEPEDFKFPEDEEFQRWLLYDIGAMDLEDLNL